MKFTVSFNQVMRQMTYHWTFLFLWLSWGTYQWFHFSYLGAIVLILLTLRLWTLSFLFRKVWLVFTLIFSLLWVIDHWIENQQPILNEGKIEGILRTNPSNLIVTEEGRIKGEGILYLSREDSINVRFYMTANGSNRLLNDVCYLKIQGKLERPAKARNFYTFDYLNYLKTQRIYWQLNIEEGRLVSFPLNFKDQKDRLKVAFLRPLLMAEDNLWTGWMKKLLFNMNSSYYTQFQEDLSYLGLLHLFAISGFHIQYFSKHLRYLFLRIGISVEYVQPLIMTILIIYGWLIGWPVGAMRAIGGLILTVSCRPWLQWMSPKDRLGIVGISILILNIRLVSSLGFLLSFLMSYLVLFYQQQLTKRIKSTPHWLIRLEMTAMCLFFSWPILLYHYFEWHPYQLLFIPILASLFEYLWMPLMALTGIGYYFIPNSILKWSGWMSNYLESSWTVHVAFLKTYFKPWIIGRQSGFYYIILFLLAALWLYLLQFSRRKAYSLYLPCLCLCILGFPYFRWTSQLTILDVGQGDALLYQPAGTTEHWLIDTGGRLNWNSLQNSQSKEVPISLAHQQKVLIPALKALGVQHLTGVVVTHSDIDHMGNLYQLDQIIPIQTVIYSKHASQDHLFNQILQTLDPGTKMIVLNDGENYKRGSLTVFQLNYGANYLGLEDNDASLLAYIEVGPYRLLNMGDLSSNYEQLLVKQYPHLNVTGLKLGHHGSQTSSSQSFLEYYQPQVAYISAGVNNRYNHPHQEVLNLLESLNIPYRSTTQCGAIQWTYSPLRGLRVNYAISNNDH